VSARGNNLRVKQGGEKGGKGRKGGGEGWKKGKSMDEQRLRVGWVGLPMLGGKKLDRTSSQSRLSYQLS